MVDKLNYIEETKETMDKNSNKLSEIKDSMKKIFAGIHITMAYDTII